MVAPPPAVAARPHHRPPPLPPLPLDSEKWTALARTLHLPPQQQRIVEMLLRGLKDKEIAAELKLKLPTVRTYLQRIFLRLNAADRMDLVLKLFAASHAADPAIDRRQ